MKYFISLIFLLFIFSCKQNIRQEQTIKCIKIGIARGLSGGCSYVMNMQKENVEVEHSEIVNGPISKYIIIIDSIGRDSIAHFTYQIINNSKQEGYEGGYHDGLWLFIDYEDWSNHKKSIVFENFQPNDNKYEDLKKINPNIPKLLFKLKEFDKENRCL